MLLRSEKDQRLVQPSLQVLREAGVAFHEIDAEKARLAAGLDKADSWATDGHKWLQLPYDSGFAIVRNAEAHRQPAQGQHTDRLSQGKASENRHGDRSSEVLRGQWNAGVGEGE